MALLPVGRSKNERARMKKPRMAGLFSTLNVRLWCGRGFTACRGGRFSGFCGLAGGLHAFSGGRYGFRSRFFSCAGGGSSFCGGGCCFSSRFFGCAGGGGGFCSDGCCFRGRFFGCAGCGGGFSGGCCCFRGRFFGFASRCRGSGFFFFRAVVYFAFVLAQRVNVGGDDFDFGFAQDVFPGGHDVVARVLDLVLDEGFQRRRVFAVFGVQPGLVGKVDTADDWVAFAVRAVAGDAARAVEFFAFFGKCLVMFVAAEREDVVADVFEFLLVFGARRLSRGHAD